MLLEEVHDYLKVGMAALTFLGVLGATDLAAARGAVGEPGALDYGSALVVAAGTFFSTTGAAGRLSDPFRNPTRTTTWAFKGSCAGSRNSGPCSGRWP